MVLINLLPHRAAARKARKEAFNIHLGVAVLVGGLLALAAHALIQDRRNVQELKNQQLQLQIAALDRKTGNMVELQESIAVLEVRQKALSALQSNRNWPVHLLAALAHQIPEGVYLTSLRQEKETLVLEGVAQSSARVSEFLHQLGTRSHRLAHPELLEVVSGVLHPHLKNQRRVSNFTLRVLLVPEVAPLEAPQNSGHAVLRPVKHLAPTSVENQTGKAWESQRKTGDAP